MQVRVLPGSFYIVALVKPNLCLETSLATAEASSIVVIGTPGFESGNNLKQCAIAEARAAIAQLGERQTEDLKVPGSIPGLGIFSLLGFLQNAIARCP